MSSLDTWQGGGETTHAVESARQHSYREARRSATRFSLDQLVDDIGNTAAEYGGETRQIGARNRLAAANRLQHDGAVHRPHAGVAVRIGSANPGTAFFSDMKP
jgi:hypothetical protein